MVMGYFRNGEVFIDHYRKTTAATPIPRAPHRAHRDRDAASLLFVFYRTDDLVSHRHIFAVRSAMKNVTSIFDLAKRTGNN
jgi:hypothetical protein